MTEYEAYSTIGATAGGLAAGFIVFFIIMMIICLAIAVLQIVASWRILTKAGQPGWGALIPFYNQYLICKITGVSPWWILIVVLSPLLSFIPVLGSLASLAASIYFTILLNVSLARAFGKEDGFAVGLILLAPIFYSILGFGKDQYKGMNPMNDFLFKENNNKNTTATTTDSTTASVATPNNASKYCGGCGAKVDANTKFCPTCGNEVK